MILFTEEQIKARIKELASQINEDYKEVNNLHLICILKGAVYFFAELSSQIEVPHSIDFITVSSYGIGQRESSEEVQLKCDLSISPRNKDVLLIEDITESGLTITTLIKDIGLRLPKRIRVATLLDKPINRKRPFVPDYVGFEIGDHFVYGYGLDIDETFRSSREIRY
jgi:hypoxanthine phosphoribosyltransferase